MKEVEQEIVIKMEPEIHQEEVEDDVPNENLVNMKNRKPVHDGIKSYACFFVASF